MTRTATDFLTGVAFFPTAFRASGFLTSDFLATAANFFLPGLAATFFFEVSFVLVAFRATGLCAAARFAFGRALAEATLFRLAAVLLEVREEDVRDVERLKPLVTALMEASK